jgi:hypothetical protein
MLRVLLNCGACAVAILAFLVVAAPKASGYELSRGRLIIRNEGVQMGAWIDASANFNVNTYRDAHYTMSDDYASQRTHFPNALMYLTTSGLREYTTNSSGMGGTETGLRTYVQQAKPDLLMYDIDPAFSGSNVWSARTDWYTNMATFRKVALEGYDGTGASPLPYGQFMNMYRSS